MSKNSQFTVPPVDFLGSVSKHYNDASQFNKSKVNSAFSILQSIFIDNYWSLVHKCIVEVIKELDTVDSINTTSKYNYESQNRE